MEIKNYTKRAVEELLDEATERAKKGLARIIEKASEEQLNSVGAVSDIYTALMEEQARQLATNPRTYSAKVHNHSRKAVRSFWWMAHA